MRKKSWWRLHSWLGLITGIPLFIIALSGSVLVFKHELDLVFEPGLQTIADPSQPRQGLDLLLTTAQSQLPDYVINGLELRHQSNGSDILYLVKKGTNQWYKAFIDGTNGQLLNQPRPLDGGVTDWLLMLHYTFLGGHIGMLIVGLLAVLLCGLGISGFVIYRRFWVNLFTLQWRKSIRILAGDFHRKLGVISAPVFFILGITGAYWNLTHAVNDLFIQGLAEKHVIQERGFWEPTISLDELAETCQTHIADFQVRYLALPTTPEAPLVFYGQVSEFGAMRSPYGMFLSFDRVTGKLLSNYDIRTAPLAHQMVDAFVPLHYGTFGGLISRVVWCLLGAAPGVLAILGFVVYWRRPKRSTRQKSQRHKEPTAAELPLIDSSRCS